MLAFDFREYYLLVRKQKTSVLEQILDTPRMNARLTRQHMEIIRLVLRQRDRRLGVFAESEAN